MPYARIVILGLAVAVVGCSSPMTTREKGAVAGGAIGAGTGAIIGSQTGHPGTGALIGAGIGAVTGAVIGDAIQGAEQKQAAPAPGPAAPPVVMAPAPAPVVVMAPPPPPLIVVAAPPQLVVVPGTPVYYAPGLSVNYFSYGGWYYTHHNGSWFVAGGYNGPWTFVAVEHVPQPVLAVPVTYYKVPPGHMKKQGGPPPWAGHGKGKNKKSKDDD